MFAQLIQQLLGAAPIAPAPPTRDSRIVTTDAKAAVLAGGEWSAREVAQQYNIRHKTAVALLKRMHLKGLIAPVRTEPVVEMRNTNCTRTYYSVRIQK